MEGKNYIEKYSFSFLVIIYGVGIAGHLYEKTLPLMLALTPYTLLLGAFVILFEEVGKDKSVIAWLFVSYAITFFVEVVGVATKQIFGDYNYGSVLGFELFDVPLIIGINWVVIVLGAISAAKRLFNNKILIVITAGFIAMSFDFILEPVAVKYGYWSWKNNVIPPQNYIAWFMIASAISSLSIVMKLRAAKSLTEKYLFIQAMFFLILNLFQ